MTLTRSKVKVKVMGLLNFPKLHFSTSISCAILACSSKLIVDHNSMGSSLQLVWTQFPFKTAITCLKTSWNVDITRISNGHVSVLLDAMVTRSGMLGVLYVLRILIWPWPDPRWRSRSLTFRSSENCTFLCLPPPLFWRGTHNLMVDYDSMGPSLQLIRAWFLNFSSSWRHVTSKFMNVDITRIHCILPLRWLRLEACDCDCR